MNWLSWTLRLVIAAAIIGLGVVYLFPLLNGEDVLTALLSLDPAWLFLVCPIAILMVWGVRTLRWHLCLALLSAPQPLAKTYLTMGSVLGLAAITPLQSGEAVKVFNLPQGLDRARATGLFALERIADLGCLFLIALAGIFVAGFEIDLWLIFGSMAVLATLAFIAIVILGRRVPIIQEALSALRDIASRPAWLVQFALLSVIAWFVTLFLWWAAFKACGIMLNASELALVLGLATLANILSIIPGALGVSEASVASLLVLQGVEPAIAITAALAIRVTGIEILGLGALHYLLLRWAGTHIVWQDKAS